MLAIIASALELLCSLQPVLHTVPQLHVCSRMLPPYTLLWLPVAFRIEPSFGLEGLAYLSSHVLALSSYAFPPFLARRPLLELQSQPRMPFLNSSLPFRCLFRAHLLQEAFPESSGRVWYFYLNIQSSGITVL